MKIYGFRQAPFNDYVNNIPDHLHQSNYMALASTLGDEYNGGPSALRCQLPCLKLQLYDLHKNLPLGGVGVFLYLFRRNPALQVLRPHS